MGGVCVTARKNSLDVFYEGSEGRGRWIDGKRACKRPTNIGPHTPVNDCLCPQLVLRKFLDEYMRTSRPFRSFGRQNNTKPNDKIK